MREDGRIRFLLQRDGGSETILWVRRTLAIYRAAVLDRKHYASTPDYRRSFIESYCDFKQWLERAGAYGARDRGTSAPGEERFTTSGDALGGRGAARSTGTI